MPTITLSKKELLKTLGKKLSDDELKDRISMLGTDLEGIEDDEVTVEIFPNRPDLLSQQGFGRALASFIGAKPGLREYPVKKGKITVNIEKSVEKCRPYTACAVIRGLSLDDEKIRELVMIQEKLHVTYGRNRKKVAIGIYPLEHIKPPIHFRGIKPQEINFRPLEARGEMRGDDILEQHPKGKDYAHLIEGLDRYACFVDDAGEVMSLTPIINSHHTGKVSEETKNVFIECSGFDFPTVEKCLNMIACAFKELGGEIESCELKYEHGKLGTIRTPRLEPSKMTIERDYINRVLGLELTEKELKKELEKMGFGYDEKKKEVLIPAYRTDILHQVDFVEDIAIAYGFENFTPEIPNVATVGQEARMTMHQRKLRELLIGHGLIEMSNYHLVSEEFQKLTHNKYLQLKNSISKEYDTMRRDTLISLLGALKRNLHHEYPQRVFEIGTGYSPDTQEEEFLAVALAGESENYTSARQIVDSIGAMFSLALTFEEEGKDWLLPGRCAKAMRGKKEVAILGELHPKVLSQLGLEVPCAVLVINISDML